ncbi:MAG TPA: EAL domain-containing protein [Beijerinckiaceae bacterium]|nr:EAL domain-containing protein [Beijerinckiaceae bacterium]
MTLLHSLLQAQIGNCTDKSGTLDLQSLLKLISEAYDEQDSDRRRTDRSINLMVEEIETANGELERLLEVKSDELTSVRLALDAAMQNTSQGLLIVDAGGRITAYNQRLIELLAFPTELLDRRPYFSELLQWQMDRGEFSMTPEELVAWIMSGGIVNSPPVYERSRPDGKVLEVRTVLLKEGGAVRTFTDITERKEQLLALQRAEHLHRSLFENAAAGLFRATVAGRLLDANLALAQIYGYQDVAGFLVMANSDSRWHAVDRDTRTNFREMLFASDRIIDFVCEMEQPGTGHRKWISTTAWLVRDAEGAPIHYEGSVTDISERKSTEQRLAYMATHDSLTGLPNRAFLMNWLASEKGRASAQRSITIHCIDLDDFKDINDDMGHAIGDLLLKQAAERMEQLLSKGDFAVRLGGDEFAVVQIGAKSTGSVERLAARLVRCLSRDYRIGKKSLVVGASVGTMTNADPRVAGEHLLKYADIALYSAKEAGGNCYRLYDSDLEARYARRRLIETSLAGALQRNEFSVVYQPILSLADGKVHHYEALLRWNHPTEGAISPAEFIPIAEQCDAINALGELVLRQACSSFAMARTECSVSVNLSPVQLRQRGFIATLVDTLATTGLLPHRLTLEITETVLLSDNPTTRAQLRDLRALGVRIALDDFGSGHSSLAYLKSYDFDQIKIDRSFIAERELSRVNGAVINAVIQLGRELGIRVVAEGIETERQLEDLRALGCDMIQGYFIGKPDAREHWPDLQPAPAEQPGSSRRVA